MGRSTDESRNSKHQRLPLAFTGAEPTKVLAVANNQSFTERVSTILSDYRRLRLLGGAHDRAQAAERLVLLKPDVVVIEADLDYEKFLEAFEADEHPEILELLNVEATLARHRYYDAYSADLAH